MTSNSKTSGTDTSRLTTQTITLGGYVASGAWADRGEGSSGEILRSGDGFLYRLAHGGMACSEDIIVTKQSDEVSKCISEDGSREFTILEPNSRYYASQSGHIPESYVPRLRETARDILKKEIDPDQWYLENIKTDYDPHSREHVVLGNGLTADMENVELSFTYDPTRAEAE
jgi:hypothetical protein